MPSEGHSRSGRGSGSAALAETTEIPLDRVKGTPVAIDGEGVLVGKLSLDQLVAMARTIIAAAVGLDAEQRKQLTEAGATANLVVILGVLDAKTVNRVFSVVLDKPEEWCSAHLDPLAALEIADAVLENNKWVELQAVFLRLLTRFRRSQTNSQ